MTDTPDPVPKNRAAVELGRKGGIKGGAVRAARMSPEDRASAAKLAADARWSRVRAETGVKENEVAVAIKRNRDGAPFVFTLDVDEAFAITETSVSGSGGLQSLQKRLQEQLSVGNTVSFDNFGLGQLIRYMVRYESGGGFQDRLRRAFDRSLRDLLGF